MRLKLLFYDGDTLEESPPLPLRPIRDGHFTTGQGFVTSTKIVEVGLWNAATQTVVRWYWTGTVWTGTDFAIAPGAGIYIILASSFTWTPILITPAVP